MLSNILQIGNKIITLNNKLLCTTRPDVLQTTQFNYISDFRYFMNEGDKISFIIRHSERNEYEDPTTGQQELTENGIKYAKLFGERLTGLTAKDDISLHSTDYNRTRDTAKYIAQGRGDVVQTVETDQTKVSLKGSIYVKTAPSTGWEDYSYFAYGEPTRYGGEFYDIDQTSQNILNYVKNNMSKTLNIFVTHDQLLEILTVYVTNKQIGLRFWDGAINDGIQEKRWITYLAGIAIIKRKTGDYEIYPVRGLDRGYQTSYSNIYED